MSIEMFSSSIDSELDFVELAYSLGKPVPSRKEGSIIDTITPTNKESAHKQSLSANFGADSFPFHTDGAYLKIPPRYILLRYIQGVENPTPTLIRSMSDITDSQRKILQYDIWKIKSRESNFYSTLLSENGLFYRYDRCVMSPTNQTNNNSIFFEQLILAQPEIVIDWHLHKTVIIDNWRYLHSRPKVQKDEISFRKIQRIMIL